MRNNHGLSLLELLVGLIIISILFTFCLPLGLSLFQKNELEVVKDELIAVIHYSRNKAALEGHPLALTTLPGSDDWSLGFGLFPDNKDHQWTPQSKPIQIWQWNHPGIHLSWQGMRSDRYLIIAQELKHSTSSGHFIIQNKEGKKIKLILNRLGRIRIELSNNSVHPEEAQNAVSKGL